jgi:hypothetical protein
LNQPIDVEISCGKKHTAHNESSIFFQRMVKRQRMFANGSRPFRRLLILGRINVLILFNKG